MVQARAIFHSVRHGVSPAIIGRDQSMYAAPPILHVRSCQTCLGRLLERYPLEGGHFSLVIHGGEVRRNEAVLRQELRRHLHECYLPNRKERTSIAISV